MAAKRVCTVTGPDVERTYEAAAIGLSAAITFAGRAKTEATFYVREPDGEIYGHVERDERGEIFITRRKPVQ